MNKALLTLISLSLISTVYATNPEAEQKPSGQPVTHFADESARVKAQKDAGILEGDRDYSDKSDFVKNRDRVEGAAQQIGKSVEQTVKSLF